MAETAATLPNSEVNTSLIVAYLRGGSESSVVGWVLGKLHGTVDQENLEEPESPTGIPGSGLRVFKEFAKRGDPGIVGMLSLRILGSGPALARLQLEPHQRSNDSEPYNWAGDGDGHGAAKEFTGLYSLKRE